MKLLRSLTFRLALYYAGLFSLSVMLLGALYYAIAIRAPLETVRRGLVVEAERFAELHSRLGAEALAAELERRAAQPADRLAYHVLIAPSGDTVTANLPSWPRIPGREWIRVEADIPQDGDEDEHEALVRDRTLADGTRLLIGRDIDDLDEIQETVTDTLVWLLPAVVLLALGGGALMSRAVGRRIEGVAAAARGVIAGDLSERVALRGSGDDFDRLGDTLNLMLDRIGQAMESVRRVSDSVAHELRTPLTRLRASLAELEQTGDPEAIGEAVQEAERLETIFNAVLRIARIEAAGNLRSTERVDLSALLADAAELYQPEAEGQNQVLAVDVEPDLVVEGDRDLLFQAVANLLDNAVKFSPEGGRVGIFGRKDGTNIVVAIEDAGPGVAAELRDRITERFFRTAEAAEVSGAGLGLALVAAVARIHDAPIRFSSAEPGLRVEWEFPVIGA